MNVQFDALQTYLSRFDIPVVESAASSLHFGVRITADFVSVSPVIAVFQGSDEIGREYISPLLGLRDYQARNLGNMANLPREHWGEFIRLATNLYRCYTSADALSVQLNPLTLINGEIAAVGCSMRVDESALFRQHHFLAELTDETYHARRGREVGITYLPLKGQIGVLSNGAGLAMATMDMIALYSDNTLLAANFLDIGNDLHVDKLTLALDLILSSPNVRTILITLFAAAHCVNAAQAILGAVQRDTPPIIVFLSGIDSDHGRSLLDGAKHPMLISAGTLREATRRAIHATTTGET